MGQIIPFPETETANRDAKATDEGCHVMIFPGVRIERHADDANAAPETQRADPSRTGT